MPINEFADIAIRNALTELAVQLDAAPHGNRSSLVKEFAAQFNWSPSKTYRLLKKVGWTSGRKPRADRGTTSQPIEVLNEVCAALRLGVRKNGKATMEIPNARSLLAANGRKFTVSNDRISQLLKQNGMDMRSQKRDRAFQPLRSLHPNHVHLVDPSLCLIYYDPMGRQHIIRDDQFYKNKPKHISRIEKWKVWRYVLVDHYSNTVVVRYYRAKGETQANLYDFLLYAWGCIDGRTFHGVPKILYWDKGSANTAAAIKIALNALEVEAIEHEAGNPRAKGSVEGMNNLVEKLFESRLKYEPVRNVDELNDAVFAWCNAFNSDSIPHYDSRLRRTGMREPVARYALWQRIRQEQLRILPDEDVCRYLLSAEPKLRKVAPDLSISIRHPVSKKREHYDVSHLPNIYPRAEVMVSPLVYGEREVIVYVTDYKGDEETYIVKPIHYDELSGFRMDAAIIGEEMKSQPDTVTEKAGKAADAAAYPGMSQNEIDKARDKNTVPFNGEIDAHSHLRHVQMPAYMQRRGSEMSVPDRVNIKAKPLSITEACKRLVAVLGPQPEGVNYFSFVNERYPDGVPEEEFNTLVERIRNPQTNIAQIK